MKDNIALITGITGQDGSYLAEFLLNKGYEVHGIIRKSSSFNTKRIDHLYRDSHEPSAKVFLHYGDLDDPNTLNKILRKAKPNEVYNLAAQSHVRVSFDIPEYTGNINALGTLRMLEAIRENDPKIKFYQASTSEMFGSSPPLQNEVTPFQPVSPYGIAKLYAHWTAIHYRQSYNLFTTSGILFNHESPRRGGTFVTKKVTEGIANIMAGKMDKLYLGNLDAKRDWGFAGDYVEAMWLMMKQEVPDDYVIATGEAHTVREFVEEAFKVVGIDIRWEGSGLQEKGIDVNSGKVLIEIDPRYFRPTEVHYLCGDFAKAQKKIGWAPRLKFRELVELMVNADLENIGILKAQA